MAKYFSPSILLVVQIHIVWFILAMGILIAIWILSRKCEVFKNRGPKISSSVKLDYDLTVQNKERLSIADIVSRIQKFKGTELYEQLVFRLISKNEIDAICRDKLHEVLYSDFFDVRLYLRTVSPRLIDTDIDYCLLILAGFKQKELYKLMNVSSSGIRNIKPRLKDKLPADIYDYVCNLNHCGY